MTDQAKYLNKNQALIKCKNHLTVELYLLQGIWGIK